MKQNFNNIGDDYMENGNVEGRVNNLEDMFGRFLQSTQESQNALVSSNQNALSMINETNGKLAMFGKTINNILHIQEEQESRLRNIEDGFEIHKENEMITPAQQEQITSKAYKRLMEFISPDSVDWALYHKAYFGDMYSYVRRNHHLAKPNACTRKKDFDDVMEGFDAWYPNHLELRETADKRRKNRLIAKQIKEKMLKEIEQSDLT